MQLPHRINEYVLLRICPKINNRSSFLLFIGMHNDLTQFKCAFFKNMNVLNKLSIFRCLYQLTIDLSLMIYIFILLLYLHKKCKYYCY